MHVTQFAPSKELAPFVRVFEVVEAADGMERTVLPDTSIIIGLRYAGSSALVEGESAHVLPGNVVTGLRATPRRMRTSVGGGIVVAKLHEMGAGAFFDEPLHQLFGAMRPLDEHIARTEVSRVSQRFARADGSLERIALFERFLLARCNPRAPDPEITEALRAIHADPARVRIAELARRVDLSPDAFEKRFRRIVGAPPKTFASVVHFRRAFEAYPSRGTKLTELAIDSGFYDQSHFNRRFRAAAGAAPGQVFGSDEYC